jgi:hypothetical protein
MTNLLEEIVSDVKENWAKLTKFYKDSFHYRPNKENYDTLVFLGAPLLYTILTIEPFITVPLKYALRYIRK